MDPIWGFLFDKNETEDSKVIECLIDSSLFSDLSKRELYKVKNIIHQRKYNKDEEVFETGIPGVGLYIVQFGRVGVYVENSLGETEMVAELMAGQYFGDVALFSDTPRTATIKAHETTVLLGICRPDLLDLIKRDPELGVKILMPFLSLAGKRLEFTNRKLSKVKNEVIALKAKNKKDEDEIEQ